MIVGSRTRSARRAHDLALDWTLRLTRGLPDAAAQDRFEQIVSDLWEQAAAADRAEHSGVRLALAILRRTLLGVPADLAWSFQQRRRRVRTARASTSAVPLRPMREGHRFDQTNGAIDFDVAVARATDTTLDDLLGKAVAANTISVGFGGGI